MTSPPSSSHPCCSAVVLAGGGASRMGGRTKAFLLVDGVSILDRQAAVLRPRFQSMFAALASAGTASHHDGLAAEAFTKAGFKVITDRYPGSGPMAGLHAALLVSRTEWLFAVGCDMPFLDGVLIDRMAAIAADSSDEQALVPLSALGPEPLHAFYRASIAPIAEECMRDGRRAMSDLLDTVRTRYLAETDLPGLCESRSLANLNTPDDVEKASTRGT